MGDRNVFIFAALCVGVGIGFGVGRATAPPASVSAPAPAPALAPEPAAALEPAESSEAPTQPAPAPAVVSQPAPSIEPVTDPALLPKAAQELPEAVRSRLPNNAFALNHAPIQGDLFKAKVAVTMYGDFQCVFCADARGILPSLRKEFGDDVVVAWRHFPVPGHDLATPAALAALAAQKQNKFWEFQEKILSNQDGLSEERLRATAQELGLDMVKFDSDRASEEASALLEVDRILGSSLKVDGTPTFLVNGRKLIGALPYETIRDAVVSQMSVVQTRIEAGKSIIQARGEISEEYLLKEANLEPPPEDGPIEP